MKVHFAITGYLPRIFGGAEVYTQNLARALQARGHEPLVVALDMPDNRGRAIRESFEGVPVQRLGFVLDFRPPPFYALQFYPELFDEARELFARERPDVVHVTNAWFTSAIACAALDLGIPVVATHVDFLWVCRESHLLKRDFTPCPGLGGCDDYRDMTPAQAAMVKTYRARLMRLLAQAYAFHHCPCPIMARMMIAAGAAEAKVGIWPYGVPGDLAQRALPKTDSDVLRLAFVGRWNRIKGVDVLLDAMERLGDAHPVRLDLYGEQEAWNKDRYGADLAARAQALPNVQVRGRFMPDRVAEVHREIDALVLSSIWPENSPVSMLEALALGTPVICADGEGMTNLVEHGVNGLVFASRDAADLADKIAALADDRALQQRLREGAQCLRTIDEDAEDFERIYANARIDLDGARRTQLGELLGTLRFAEEMYQAGTLVRRVRDRFADLAARGAKRLALFGAGRHTLKLLGTCDVSGANLVAILDENPDACGGSLLGIPVLPLAQWSELALDAVVVSSDMWEPEMLERLAPLRDQGVIVAGLYGGEDA